MEDLTTAVSEFTVSIDTMWILVAAVLVMFMQPGFALVEAGFTRGKNTVNILMKNLMDFSIGSLIFWALGYTLMYGEDVGGFVGKISLFFGSNEINGVPDKALLLINHIHVVDQRSPDYRQGRFLGRGIGIFFFRGNRT